MVIQKSLISHPNQKFLALTQKIVFFFALILSVLQVYATDMDTGNVLELNGVVYEVPDVIEGCNIIVHQNGVPTIFTRTDDKGTYTLKLALGNDYIIEFSYPGYTTKTLAVSTRNANADDPYVLNNVIMDLFQELQTQQASFDLSQPIAKIAYNNTTSSFEYDMEYNAKIQKKVQQLWNTVYNERIVRDENFSEAMTTADSSFSLQDYPIAKAGYVNALSYRPMAIEPKEKIKFIDSLMIDEVEKILGPEIEPVEVYSDHIIEDVYHIGKKVITKRQISKEESATIHYRRVETNFGTYYFKNNTPISSILWEIETEKQ